jgi:hypothetical protein
MQRRTLLQVISGALAALFVGFGRAAVPMLPARLTKRVSAMPFVKFLDKPIRRPDGAVIVARMVSSGDAPETSWDRPYNLALNDRTGMDFEQLLKEKAPPAYPSVQAVSRHQTS